MNSFPIGVSHSSLPKPSPSLSCASRAQSFVSNRITCPRGTVGCYDITELNDQLKYFAISEETKKAITRKQKFMKPSSSRWGSTILSTPHDMQHTNGNAQPKSREQTKPPSRHSAGTRSCYVDFTGSFNGSVRAQSLPLATRHSAPLIPQSFRQTQSKSSKATRVKRPRSKTKRAGISEPVQIKDGLLVIANGQIVNLQKDIKRSELLEDHERKRLRKEMRQQLNIVRSFDELFEELDATKTRIEKLKAA